MTVQTTTPTSTRSESGDAQQKFSLWQDVADENFCPMAKLFFWNEHLHVPPQFNCFQAIYIYIVVSLNPRCRTHPTLQHTHICIYGCSTCSAAAVHQQAASPRDRIPREYDVGARCSPLPAKHYVFNRESVHLVKGSKLFNAAIELLLCTAAP